MDTVEIGSTFPTEETSTGIDFWETFATTTGTLVDRGGGAVFAVQLHAETHKSATNALLERFEECTDTSYESSPSGRGQNKQRLEQICNQICYLYPARFYNKSVKFRLDRMTDRQLLDLRLCDLPIRIRGTQLEQRIKRLYRELESRSLHFRPHVWLGEEWFTPDGVAGFAIPFYLAHPRLMKLERSQMLEVEGASESECMRILRHEAGHAIDNAYRLHSRRSWSNTFGSYRGPY